MAGNSITVDLRGLDDAQRAIARLGKFDLGDLLDAVGTEVVDQVKDRIGGDKQAPDGTPWPAWSPDYAATRGGGHGLLESEGHLLTSIQQRVSGSAVEIGTNLVYGAIQQFGGAEVGRPGLKPRPYLGLSTGDRDDVRDVVEDFLGRLAS